MQMASYEEIIKLQPRGVFTVPKKLRKGLFEDNNLAKITRVGRRLVIEPVTTLAYPVRSYSEDEVAEFFANDNEETQKLKTKGLL